MFRETKREHLKLTGFFHWTDIFRLQAWKNTFGVLQRLLYGYAPMDAWSFDFFLDNLILRYAIKDWQTSSDKEEDARKSIIECLRDNDEHLEDGYELDKKAWNLISEYHGHFWN